MRPAKLSVLLLAGVLLVACAAVVISVDCGGNLKCTASKFLLAHLLIGIGVVVVGSIGWSSLASLTPLSITPLQTFPPRSIPREISARPPPSLR
jgi:hypothetical protein